MDNEKLQNTGSSAGAGAILSALLMGVAFVLVVIIIASSVSSNKALVMNCMPIMGNELDGKMMSGKEASKTSEEEGFAPVTPFFDADGLKPKATSTDPDWAQKYASATSGLMGQNFVDNADPRKYTMTRSTCGRRFMSRDLRRVPVPTRDPSTVTSFGLPYIAPECVRFWEDSRPALDC